MPSIKIHPPRPVAKVSIDALTPQFPQLLATPSGLALLEIQGTINATGQQEKGPGDLATQVGRLVFPLYDAQNPTASTDTAWHKRVYLYVGKHQRLTGEVKTLSKPIAVLRRRANPATPALECDTPDEELEIVEIVRHKLLFTSRPEPVGGGTDTIGTS